MHSNSDKFRGSVVYIELWINFGKLDDPSIRQGGRILDQLNELAGSKSKGRWG